MSEVLSSSQVDALQAVDLRLGWVRHGIRPNEHDFGFPRENGPAIFGVNDTDYAVPATLLSDMGTGDISVRERVFTQGMGDEAPSNARILSEVNSLLFQSPYVDDSPLRGVKDYAELLDQIRNNASPAAVHNSPTLRDGLVTAIGTLRKLRIGGPFLYADGLATANGTHRAIADSSNEDYGKGEISLAQRNEDMARGLGNAAMRIIRIGSTNTTPKVTFTAGSGHKEVEDILDSYGVAYSSMEAKRPRTDSFLGLNGIFRRTSTLNQRLAHNWFNNLREQGHTPINQTLRKRR